MLKGREETNGRQPYRNVGTAGRWPRSVHPHRSDAFSCRHGRRRIAKQQIENRQQAWLNKRTRAAADVYHAISNDDGSINDQRP